jgi:phosphoserine phosphatase RsbU/P
MSEMRRGTARALSRLATGLLLCGFALAADAQEALIRISREDLFDIAVGAVFIACGIAALALQRLRGRAAGGPFLTLGAFSILYGIRLGHEALAVLGMPASIVDYVEPFVTYILPLAPFLYARRAIGSGWKHSITAIVAIQVGYASAAMILDLLHEPEYAMRPNNYLMLTSFCVLSANIVREVRKRDIAILESSRRSFDTRLIAAGIVVMTLFVLNENAVSAGLVPWSISYEPLGVLAFIACVAAALAHRLFTREVAMAGLEHELDTARRIQQSILPAAPPRVGGVRIAARYQPMTAIGGDFYDFLVEGDRITVLIADVSGHGVPAALVASMVKVAFGAQRHHGSDPAAVLNGIRDALAGSVPARHMVTAACISIDQQQGVIRYANAGHPPLLIRRGSEVAEVLQPGVPIGAFRNAVYRNESIELAGGARLLLYSDGVTEASNAAGEHFGEERLRRVFEGRTADAVSGADAIVAAIEEWRAGQGALDDLTVVIIDLDPASSGR